ncbi:hypothetical protein ACHAPT_008410 [Fusarium lateritium]
MERRDNIIAPWQQKALENNRRPLPDAPGGRPWVTHPDTAVAVPAAYFNAVPDPDSFRGVRWSARRIARLLALRQKGESWEDIAASMDRKVAAIVSMYALWYDRLYHHVLEEEDKESDEAWLEAHKRWHDEKRSG